MKKFLLIGVAAIALATVSVKAQAPIYASTPVTLTNTTVALSSASNQPPGALIYCGKQKDVAVQLTFRTDASGTENMTVKLLPSVDGVNFDTSHSVTFGGAGITAGTLATYNTNITVGGIGYLKVLYITNGSPTYNATNVTLSYGIKISAP